MYYKPAHNAKHVAHIKNEDEEACLAISPHQPLKIVFLITVTDRLGGGPEEPRF